MRQEIYKFEGCKYVRITAPTAKKLFDSGAPVGLLAYNLKPGPWVQIPRVTNYGGATLASLTDTYLYLCTVETGKTVKYFKIIES